MTEFIHIHLIDKRPIGTKLKSHLPLHMTALHWFESPHEPSEIIEKTALALRGLGVVEATATEEDLFGPKLDIPVMRLAEVPKLIQIHTTLMAAMEELGATFNERWTGLENYKPHVTHKADSRLYSNDEIIINDIDLISRSDKNTDKIILERFTL